MITQVNEVSNNHKFIDTQNIINKKAKVYIILLVGFDSKV